MLPIDLSGKRAMEDLKELDRKKDVFLATLAHELRNPLAPLLTGLDVMRRGAADTEMVKHLSQTLESQVEQMSRLVDELLDMSRVRLGKITLQEKVVPVGKLLDDISAAIEPKAAEYGHQFIVTRPEKDLQVRVDPMQLEQALLELVSNALDAMPSGGRLRLGARAAGGDGTGGEVVIEVGDTGPGIPAGVLPSVCEPFFTTRQDGTGLGLAIAKRYVEQNGGRLEIDSTPGSGTTARVRLPVGGSA